MVWEVLSLGEKPYCHLEDCDVIPALMRGKRLEVPQHCPQIV